MSARLPSMTTTTTEKRATYRFRNTKTHWVIPEMIHTFWVGQRVVRSWERKAFQDLIGQEGRVVALPDKGSTRLTVLLDDGTEKTWYATECLPLRKVLEGNRNRLRDAAKDYSAWMDALDENGEARK